jgi:hypothetical protein
MSDTTEDFILSNIPGVDDASDSGGADSGGGSSADRTGGGTGGEQRTTSAEPSGSTQNNTNEVRRRHDGLLERPNEADPKTRDLVDPRTGRVVARGGIERHVFEEGQRHARENATLKQQLSALQAHVGTTSEVSRVANEMQLSPENQVVAIRVMGDFLKDPVRTLQSLVEEVKSKGYEIPFLTQGVTPGMDLGAIQRMIDAKFAPITQAQEQQRQQEAQRAHVGQQLDTFLNTNPEANSNLDVLAQMMQAQPHLTLHDAYTKMMRWSYDNGLDYSQPLRPQIDAINQQAAQQQPTQQPNGRRPLPGGRSANYGANGLDTTRAFNENTPWGDIIRHSMEESGMSFS